MKKLFLLVLLTSFVGLVQAQQTTVRAPERTQPKAVLENQALPGPSVFKEFLAPQDALGKQAVTGTTKSMKKTKTLTNLYEIGLMANVYGMMGDNRQQITYDPRSDRVAVIFRGNDRGASDGNTIYIRYSNDGGKTWGPQGDNVSNALQPRYPNIAMVPESDGSTTFNALWAEVMQYGDGGSGFGAVGSMKSGFGNSNPLYSPFPTPPIWSIPWEQILDQKTGNLYTMALALDPLNGAGLGEIYLLKSTDGGATWTADLNEPIYTSDMVPPGYFSSNLRLDISPDGSTMIMAFNLIIESEPGRAYLLDQNHEVTWKVSKDMGKTWGPMQRVKPAAISNPPRPFDFMCNMGWDMDMIIDRDNKPHFLVTLSADVNPFGLDRPTDSTISLLSCDSTFACELTQSDVGGPWSIVPIGPIRRPRVDRYSFTAANEDSSPYLIRSEGKWARNWEGDKLYAKWISPYMTWRIGYQAGEPALFSDTLTQIYINGRHIDTKGSLNPYVHKWDFSIPDANTTEMDSMMRYTGDLLSLFEEDGTFGAKFTKIAKYVSDQGDVFVISPEFGVGERRDDDPVYSDQIVWFVQNLQVAGVVVDVEQLDIAPAKFELSQNYPNPFNPSTQISFTLPEAAQTTLRVFNLLGQEVATLTDGFINAGTHSITFDARSLPSGMYVYRLESGDMRISKKMMLNK